ncbi:MULTISPECIES: hypothetical protein [Bacillaceae]|uniref:Uncharacterized protein n=1 Tax=Evansella alkalicola TaxID=745819 RepID=A0ABS6K0U4_9BACI|nr:MULTISPECIES: hypothetical protein [Bacillaceae]MBU9723554.1 hypothetical protein [Bacillus alkalicola]
MKYLKGRLSTNPFIFLSILHFLMLIYTFLKSQEKKKLFILLLSNIGKAYIFDYIIVGKLKAYKYKPNVLKNKYLDHILGVMFSQSFFVPITAVFITAFRFGWKVKLLFSLYFFAIEKLFLKLKIHQVYWWRTYYTFFFINFYFWLSDKWFERLKEHQPVVTFISLYNVVEVTWKTIWLPFALLKKARFGTGKRYTWKEHFSITPLYTYSLSMMMTWILKRGGMISYGFFLCVVIIVDKALRHLKLLKVTSYKYILFIHLSTLLLGKMYKTWIYE